MLKKNKSILILTSVLAASTLIGCSSAPKHESTGQYIDSSVVTTKVKAKILSDNVLSKFPITVKTYKNTVQLSGFVDTPQQRNRAEQIARSVPGVQEVEDSLIVKSR